MLIIHQKELSMMERIGWRMKVRITMPLKIVCVCVCVYVSACL